MSPDQRPRTRTDKNQPPAGGSTATGERAGPITSGQAERLLDSVDEGNQRMVFEGKQEHDRGDRGSRSRVGRAGRASGPAPGRAAGVDLGQSGHVDMMIVPNGRGRGRHAFRPPPLTTGHGLLPSSPASRNWQNVNGKITRIRSSTTG